MKSSQKKKQVAGTSERTARRTPICRDVPKSSGISTR